ncbi:MAG: xanthine dehydrogenase family protein molybdopterin-binding subunit, partial [Dehalococcoidia bacterium]|nr:xanthine dehydrogenase family protein molybdopterin-binding subunit [Dehalococcoidia bacterium]
AVLRYDDPEIKGKMAMSSYGAEDEILADYAHFEGQEVGAVVAADSEDIADAALKLIDVEWEQRPFVLDQEEAAQPGAVLARPEWYPESNELPRPMWVSPTFEMGDIEKGFKEADKIIEFKARRRYHGGASVETPNGISRWEGDCLELWVHHQHPYEHKWAAHSWFGIPMSKVKINAPYSGAMYGGWNWVDYSMVPQYVSAILAKRTRKPVKWIFNRRDDFYFGQMDVMVGYFKVGFKNDGTITAVKIKTYFANLRSEAAGHLLENTRIPNIYSETVAVQVNKGPVMALRCEQAPAAFGFIHVFDRVAAELGMDPTELALKNDGVEGEDMEYLAEFKRKHGFPVRDSLKECVEAGKNAMGWDEKWHAPGAKRLPNGKMHGMGFIWDHEWDDNRGAAVAGVLIQQDGSVSIVSQHSDIGVNGESAYCQVVAEELGMRYEDVFIRQQDDVHFALMTPDGSCNLITNAYVLKKAARKAKQKLLELATSTTHRMEKNILAAFPDMKPEDMDSRDRDVPAAFPGMKPEELDVKDSVIYVKADPSNRKTVAEVVKDVEGSISFKTEMAAIQNTTHEPVYAWAWHRQGRYGAEPGRHRLCRQTHFCEVEVDDETGEVEVTKVVNVNDVGKAISPETVEGQMYGGTYMGVSRNKTEEYIWDEQTGVLLNGDFLNYKFATMNDIGPIETIIKETGMGYGPYGSVGVAENLATVETFLIQGAVYNAIGKWLDDYPITPDKVLKALGKA